MKKASKDFSTFEKFKLEKLKIIIGGTGEGGGPIDPPIMPGSIGTPSSNDRP